MARGFPGSGSTNYLSVGDTGDAFDPTADSWTLSCWVYLNAAASGSGVICAHWNGSVGWILFVLSGGTTVRWSANTSNVDTAAGIGTGAWHHIAVTKNGNTGTIYVDGVSSNSNGSMTALVDRNLSFYWGRRDSGTTTSINGSIARVCAWNSVLTASEIAALTKGMSPVQVRPVNYSWHEGWGVGDSGEPDLHPYDSATPKNLSETGTITVTDHAPVCPPFPIAA